MSEDEICFMLNKDTNIYDLYNFIKHNITFEKVITLYKLLQNKIITLEDKPDDHIRCVCDEDKNMDNMNEKKYKYKYEELCK